MVNAISESNHIVTLLVLLFSFYIFKIAKTWGGVYRLRYFLLFVTSGVITAYFSAFSVLSCRYANMAGVE